MGEASVTQATLLAGIVIANFGFIIGAYVSLKVGQAVTDVKVGRLEADVNNLAKMIKNKKENEET